MKVIILAGGGGTRLFPLSRACYPKQFLKIAGEQSLLIQTVKRYLNLVAPNEIIIVTNEEYVFHVKSELDTINIKEVHVLAEPVGRNTAPAIALALAYCKDKLDCDENEIIFVGPSDHVIKPDNQFRKLVKKNIEVASKGYIVTLGIEPTKPEIGYGYIEITDEKIVDAFIAKQFIEKPNLETALQYISDGRHFWNSGMYMFSIGAIEQDFSEFSPEITSISNQGYEFLINHFGEMPEISIDYAIAERSKKIVLAPMNGISWNDVGSFDAISEMLSSNGDNFFDGDVFSEGCNNTMILGGNRFIAGIDLQDLMVIDTPDVLLVAKKGESQKVKNLVSHLKNDNRKEAFDNVTMYRPWGSYTILSEGEGYKVKKIIVNPGQKLSLQMHYHRSEHWTVIVGTGRLTLDDNEIIFGENESTYIPIGARHRLENPGKIPLAIIEVQNGTYLGEDDIVRFDDIYGRDV